MNILCPHRRMRMCACVVLASIAMIRFLHGDYDDVRNAFKWRMCLWHDLNLRRLCESTEFVAVPRIHTELLAALLPSSSVANNRRKCLCSSIFFFFFVVVSLLECNSIHLEPCTVLWITYAFPTHHKNNRATLGPSECICAACLSWILCTYSCTIWARIVQFVDCFLFIFSCFSIRFSMNSHAQNESHSCMLQHRWLNRSNIANAFAVHAHIVTEHSI